MNQKILFILVNIVFGSLLLFTYYRGLTVYPETAAKLWGGMPKHLTPYIVSSMFVGAIGYFFFTYYLLFKIDYQDILIFNQFKFSLFILLYILI